LFLRDISLCPPPVAPWCAPSRLVICALGGTVSGSCASAGPDPRSAPAPTHAIGRLMCSHERSGRVGGRRLERSSQQRAGFESARAAGDVTPVDYQPAARTLNVSHGQSTGPLGRRNVSHGRHAIGSGDGRLAPGNRRQARGDARPGGGSSEQRCPREHPRSDMKRPAQEVPGRPSLTEVAAMAPRRWRSPGSRPGTHRPYRR
jgi:hypothetical protein